MIINFGKAFKVENKRVEEAFNKYMKIQKECLLENERVKEDLEKGMKLTKKYPNI